MRLVGKSLFYLFIFSISIILLSFAWGFTFGKTQIHEKTVNINSKKIPSEFNNSKIITFSDIDLNDNDNSIELLKNTIDKINSSHPQYVVFQGGLIDPDKLREYHLDQEKVVNELLKIKSKYGKYAILSTDDQKNKETKNLIEQTLKMSGFIILKNSRSKVYIDSSNKHINFINYRTTNSKSLKLSNKEFNIAFENKVENIIHLRNEPIDYFLYGYDLNGLVQPEFVQSIFKDQISKIKSTINGDTYKNIKLISNPGIGTRILKFRLWNNPKIVILNLIKE